MTLSEKIIRLIRNTFDTVLYFAVMAVKEDFRNYVGRAGRTPGADAGQVRPGRSGSAKGGGPAAEDSGGVPGGVQTGRPRETMAVLGNGPSLARELPGLLERTGDRDFMAVNFFALDERFTLLRPAYYVLSDPMFFRESAFRDRVAGLYRAMNERVSWPMTLYVQYYNPERFDYRAVLPNPLIRIVPFHTYMYRGFCSVEFWLFRRGLGSANFGTVVQVGEYVALLLGYRRVELYGVDHTLLEGLCVDGRNRLCRADRHYYDAGAPAAPQPVFRKVPPVPYTMASYLAEVAELFRGHEVLRDYAASLGVRIVNCTRGSMIDAYERAAE